MTAPAAAISAPDRTDDWATPAWLFDAVKRDFGRFNLDAAASQATAKVSAWFGGGASLAADGLAAEWFGTVWCNPPYRRGEIERWIAKGIDEVAAGRAERCVFLIPANTDTAWWHDLVWPHAAEVRMLRGRVSFDGPKNGKPTFGSAIVVFSRGHRGPPSAWCWDPRSS